MRVNVYSQEMTNEVSLVPKVSDTGIEYWGVKFVMKSPPELHSTITDDDRTAVVFWFREGHEEETARMFEEAAQLVRSLES